MARAAAAATASNAPPARLRTVYDTGAAATEDDGPVATGERVGPGFADAAGALLNGAIPTDGAGVAADTDDVLPDVAEPVAGERVVGGGLVGVDVVTDVATKPDPLTWTRPGAPFEGWSVMTGPAGRVRDRIDDAACVGGVVAGRTTANDVVAQTVGAATRQTSTAIGAQARPGAQFGGATA